MFFPFSTDAPIYYWPISTVGLILLNCVFSVFMWTLPPQSFNQWMLLYGQGLHPLQWFSSVFMHADAMHLLGNMFFLWAFGLLVEGKLGWWKFLLVYLAIGGGQSAFEQVMMLGYEPSPLEQVKLALHPDSDALQAGSLGASAAIFGLVAIALVWAPRNEIKCMYWITFVPRLVDVPMTVFATLYLGLQFLLWMLSAFQVGSALLHLMGAALGFVVGAVLLKRNVVDCEGWDLFAVIQGTEGSAGRRIEQAEIERKAAQLSARQKEQQDQLIRSAEQQIEQFANDGNPVAAAALMRKMSELGEIQVSEPALLKIIGGLVKQKRFANAIVPMTTFISRFPDRAGRVRLMLGQILLFDEKRPGRALSVLEKITAGELPANEEQLRLRLVRKAQEMHEEGDLELDTDGD